MTETTVDRKLFEIFDEAFDLYNSFETSEDPTNSVECQVNEMKLLMRFVSFTQPK